MCGIAGSLGPSLPDGDAIQRTFDLMGRRGPDALGAASRQMAGGQLQFLHSRLSIIDLDPRSNQPFEVEGCVLIYNGEIYNYLELRRELESKGHKFTTDSDTEVIVRAYLEYGEQCVEKFDGMWAFALFDPRNNLLLLSRDRFGEKPLFVMQHDGHLYFGSEVKFLAALSGVSPKVDERQISRYLINGYKSLYKQPATFFSNIRELPAAANAVIRRPDEFDPKLYWRLEYHPRQMTKAEAIEGVRENLFQSLRRRLRADVPIAFCLSGGIDSTALASIAAKDFGADIHAFTVIDRDERYNETENVSETVRQLGCSHYRAEVGTENFFERLADLVDYHDAPIATISYYVHSFLSEAIADKGFKVAISGTGADELFTGYYDHYSFWLAEMHGCGDFEKLLADWRAGYGAFVQNPRLQDPLVFHHSPDERGHIYLNRDLFNVFMLEPLKEDFSETRFCESNLRNRMLNELNHEVVPVILREDDLNSMYWSVENRSPYLSHELAEFAYSIPSEHLISDGFAKHLLREAVHGIAPPQVMEDKRKRGFNTAIDTVIDRREPATMERLLTASPILDYVDRTAFETFVSGDMTDNSFSKFLFSFVSAKTFLESDLILRPHAALEVA